MSDHELYHHGIKDMKWGQRRFQNKDGSLTPAGRLRYRAKEGLKKTGDKLKEQHAKRKSEKAAEKLRKKPISELTDDELQARIARAQKEQQLFDLERPMSSVKQNHVSAAKNFMSTVGNQVLKPAAINAGKEILERWLKKQGYDLAGLKDTQYGITQLMKEAEEAKLRKEKASNTKQAENLEDQIKEMHEKKAKKAADEKAAAKKAKVEERVEREVEDNIKRADRRNKKSTKKAAKEQRRAEKEANKVYTGKVTGEGTSKRRPENDGPKKKPDDYYKPIEVDFTVHDDTPASSAGNSTAYRIGRDYVERLLLNP